jgi:cell division ATPase FtsA
MKESTAILDIGSSTVVALVGEHGVNGTFKVCGKVMFLMPVFKILNF